MHTCRWAKCGYIGYCFLLFLYGYGLTDFSAEDEASDIKFFTPVHRRPRQEISFFVNFALTEAMGCLTLTAALFL